MNDVYIREGATFEETLTDTDITADTLTLTVSDQDGTAVLVVTENYEVQDGQAVVTISEIIDLEIGDYNYMYTITYEDGFILKLPDPQDCYSGDCGLPAFMVCDANDIGSS
jgi:hypothetical protein